MDFHTRSAEHFLMAERLNEYREGISFFYAELIDLNVDLYLAETILGFPFGVLANDDKTIFFSRVLSNSMEMSTITIYKIATDNGTDVYNIRKFKNRVLEMMKDEFKEDFHHLLRTSKFDTTTTSMLERVRNLRNQRIAHSIKIHALTIPEKARVGFAELSALRDVLNDQMDLLSFDTEYMMLPIPYDGRVQHPGGVRPSTDIEDALDGIARQSPLLNTPERSPRTWERIRFKMAPAKLAQINLYRRRFDLPEA